MARLKQLSQKQINFCNNVVKGMTYSEAYRNAYNCSNMSKNSIYQEGSKLAMKPEIKAYIKTLNEPIKELAEVQSVSARQQQIDFINSRIQHCIEVEDEQSLIRYTDMLNKIHGIYKETDTSKKEQTAVQNLDTESLIKLIG